MSDRVVEAFLARAGLGPEPSLTDIVEALRGVPYARPSVRAASCLVTEWRGTCSTKHALLAQVIEALFPLLEPQIVHRVYRVTRENAPPRAAHTVPLDGERIPLDVTFPGTPWDGASAMTLACGDGVDHPATDHPAVGDIDQQKKSLEGQYCDPIVREPFIAALS